MNNLTRRQVSLGLAASLPLLVSSRANAQSKARVVIIGGGFGGATAARMLRDAAPNLSIILIEKDRVYKACPLSNLVVAGYRGMALQRFDYGSLTNRGVDVIHDTVTDIDPATRKISLENSAQPVGYDKLIMSPGIELRWNAIEGYDQEAAHVMPHAWKAGDQTVLLRDQLRAMPDGGTVVISVPKAPYRCPPGPYERASLIAQYLKTHKPRSKLLILDAKDDFSKKPLFEAAWEVNYPDLIEWRSFSNDGTVVRVDPSSRTVFMDFDEMTADVVNVIPPQRAAEIARRAGVTDFTGWCPVNPLTFESTEQTGIHVIGDAAIANPMPKSAFSAALQGKLCALQIMRELQGLPPEPTVLTNTCYSFVTPDQAVSITGVYRNGDGELRQVPGAGGLSPQGATVAVRQSEAAQADGWYLSATYEAFG